MTQNQAVRQPASLGVAVSVDGRFLSGRVNENGSWRWVLGIRSLEVWLQMDNPPSAYLVARVYDYDKKLPEFQRLLFGLNNRVGEFLIRVYRDEEAAARARDDFDRPIQPSTDL